MRLTSFRLLVFAIASLPAVALGDGLIYRLPKDGTWARFKYELSGTSNGRAVDGLKGTVTISSVGSVVEDDEPCRWIEIRRETIQSGRSGVTVGKFLVPERHLVEGGSPVDYIRRAWVASYRRGQEPKPAEVMVNGPLSVATAAYLIGPSTNSETAGKVTVDSPALGIVECDSVHAAYELATGSTDVSMAFLTYLHKRAPFGVASCTIKMTSSPAGDLPETTLEQTFLLADFGDGASSVLTEPKDRQSK